MSENGTLYNLHAVLYGCGTPQSMREERILEVFKNKELKRIVGAKKAQEQRSEENFDVILILLECLNQGI
jgi:hypothetical protein